MSRRLLARVERHDHVPPGGRRPDDPRRGGRARRAVHLSAHVPDTITRRRTRAPPATARTVAQDGNLLAETAPQATLCFTCHDGTGSSLDTEAQFTDPTVPANDVATRSYYRPRRRDDPVVPNAHVLATDRRVRRRLQPAQRVRRLPQLAQRDGGRLHPDDHRLDRPRPAHRRVRRRRRERARRERPDLHVPRRHGGDVSRRASTSSASSATPASPRCPPTPASRPRRRPLDKAVELNPANASYHPVEAAGTNSTHAMAMQPGRTRRRTSCGTSRRTARSAA